MDNAKILEHFKFIYESPSFCITVIKHFVSPHISNDTKHCYCLVPLLTLRLHLKLFSYLHIYFALYYLHFSNSNSGYFPPAHINPFTIFLPVAFIAINYQISFWSINIYSSHVWMWELDYEESWAPKNWCFWTVVLEKTLESSLD